jgi:VanZ family protein
MNRLWWALGVVLVGAAVYVCLVPSPDVPGAFQLNDKVSHALGHASMAMYFAGLVPRRGWWKIFVFLLLLGVGIEAAQHFMRLGRQADITDIAANSVGALSGLLLARLGIEQWPQWVAWLSGRRAAS